MPRQEFRVYLSSTLADLGPERNVALQTIAEFGVVQTSYRASENGVLQTCIDDVQRCALYIGILGLRYGYLPEDPEANPQQLSITELEYRSCVRQGAPAIPRLIFIKPPEAGIAAAHIDALSHPDTAPRMAAFLDRAAQEQTVYPFLNLEQLRAELRIRVKEHADQFHRENAVTKPILHEPQPWANQLVPVMVACVPGSDHVQRNAIRQYGGNRFRPEDLSPDDERYLATLDTSLRRTQLGCLLVTPASLSRLTAEKPSAKVARGLAMMRTRLGKCVVLCEGVSPQELPASWQPDLVIELPVQQLVLQPATALDCLYEQLRTEMPTLTVEPRLALPYLVLAPTLREVQDLGAAEPTTFDKAKVPGWKLLREAFDRIAEAAKKMDARWPLDTYAEERWAWRCFGTGSPSAQTLVEQAVERINEAAPGSRERRFLRNARLVARRYDLREYAPDIDIEPGQASPEPLGSRSAVEAVRESGCLFIVDEFALLHPRLREVADSLLVGAKSAVVAVCPCDPAHTATGLLLGDFSYLRVGSLVTRFRSEQDPRCEIALNNLNRVERWLRATIPELVSGAENLESDPNLVEQMARRMAQA